MHRMGETMLKKYQFCFNPLGFSAFLLVMLPNFVWFAVPAPNDILHGTSLTPVADALGMVFQVLLAGALCLLRTRKHLRCSAQIFLAVGFLALYYTGWVLYYSAITAPVVILLLTFTPCLALLFFAADRKNTPAMLCATCFTICHGIYGILNFIV